MAETATAQAAQASIASRRRHRRRHHIRHDVLHRGGESVDPLDTGTGMPFTGAMTATVLIAFSMTLLMGLYARLPFAVAPGMGLNAFFAFTIVLQQHVPWQTALGMVFWAGVLFLLRLGDATARDDRHVDSAESASGRSRGIGLLLTLIGLRNVGID
jgi:AGZA family xanthine/uracil permease-like MFS transporter